MNGTAESLLRQQIIMAIQQYDVPGTTSQMLFLRVRARVVTPGSDIGLLHRLIREEIDELDVPVSARHDAILFELEQEDPMFAPSDPCDCGECWLCALQRERGMEANTDAFAELGLENRP